MEQKKYKPGDNPKGQGPCKPKKEKTKEEKEAARAKAAEKKRLKKEQARLEEEAKKKAEEESKQTETETKTESQETKPEEKKQNNENENENKKNKKKNKKEAQSKNNDQKPNEEKNKNRKESLNVNNRRESIGKDQKKAQKKSNTQKIFGLKTYKERIQEINSKNENNILNNDENINNTNVFNKQTKKIAVSSSEIIKNMSTKVEHSKVTEELIYSLHKISVSGSHKRTNNCYNLLNALKDNIQNINGDIVQVCKEVMSLIKTIVNTIYKTTEVSAGIDNTCRYLKQINQLIASPPSDMSPEKLKEDINDKIDDFIYNKIQTKHIINNKILNSETVENLIKNGDTILFYGKSKFFRKIAYEAKQKKIDFKVVYVDTNKSNKISSEIEFLSNLGVPVTYSYLNAVSNVIKDVAKVIIKGESMLYNGALKGKLGTALLACIANNFKKPVIVLCQTFNFSDKIMFNSFSHDDGELNRGKSYKEITLDYDITPANYINMLICELGNIPATSVPVLIREFWKNEMKLNK